MRGYVAITEDAMRGKVQDEMGFTRVFPPKTRELVFQRDVDDRYAVRIYTSVDCGISRETGFDAIRVTVFDKVSDRLVKVEKRVNRTENALSNMHARAREVWGWVLKHRCPDCGSVMAERKSARGKFLGCTGYPECKRTMRCN